MPTPIKSPDVIYQLKITLDNSRPSIWRRVLVPGSFNLYQLHQVIQGAMGWIDSHLHQFSIDGEYYGIPSIEDWAEIVNVVVASMVKSYSGLCSE